MDRTYSDSNDGSAVGRGNSKVRLLGLLAVAGGTACGSTPGQSTSLPTASSSPHSVYLAAESGGIRGRVRVSATRGMELAVGQACDISGASVGRPSEEIWHVTVRCGPDLVYDGISHVTWEDWQAGRMAVDLETSSEDGTPSFEWTRASAVLADDPTGSRGSFRVEFLPTSLR